MLGAARTPWDTKSGGGVVDAAVSGQDKEKVVQVDFLGGQ